MLILCFFIYKVVAIYEGVKKRLFPTTIAIAVFSLPFLLEMILLRYWNIGSADQSKDGGAYCLESDCLKRTKTEKDTDSE